MSFRFAPHVSLLSAFCLAASGCMFQNISNGELLRDAVNGINEEARWSRIDLAVARVDPTYRDEYLANRHQWGQDIQIADTEVLAMRLDDDQDNATSVAIVRWYRYSNMTLEATHIEQVWKNITGGFVLSSETVISGNPDLLAPPEPEPEDEGNPESTDENRTLLSAVAN